MKSMEMGKAINIEVRYGLSDIMSLGSVDEVGRWLTAECKKLSKQVGTELVAKRREIINWDNLTSIIVDIMFGQPVPYEPIETQEVAEQLFDSIRWWQTIVVNKITDMEYKGKDKK